MKWKVWMDLVACAEGILMMSLWTRVVVVVLVILICHVAILRLHES